MATVVCLVEWGRGEREMEWEDLTVEGWIWEVELVGEWIWEGSNRGGMDMGSGTRG